MGTVAHHGMFFLLNQQGALIIQTKKQTEGTAQSAETSLFPLVIRCLVSLFPICILVLCQRRTGHKQPQQGRCLLRSSAEPLCVSQESQPGAPRHSSLLLCDPCTHGIRSVSYWLAERQQEVFKHNGS